MLRTHNPFLIPFVLLWSIFMLVPATAPEDSVRTAVDPTSSPVIVIGFVGGFVRHNNPVHTEVQLAARLRKEYSSGVYVEVFQNHDGSSAYKKILQLLDTDRAGKPTLEEKHKARIILYGHSWGASEAISLARRLEADGIPVLLTVQIDSVTKLGEDDGIIPSNVAQAANFYQPDGRPHGRAEIRAADPSRTRIIGNFRFDYAAHPVACYGDYSWWDRYLSKPHTEIECDPQVWNHVESLIRADLPPPAQSR
jgi:pimeloyl-ACP methyl ester carboxylesterase